MTGTQDRSRDRAAVEAELGRLRRGEREALVEAVATGRAVDDVELAGLAADHAALERRRLARLFGWVMVAVGVVAAAVAAWATSGDVVAAVVVWAAVVVAVGAPFAASLGPYARARQANLHAAGLTDSGRSDPSWSHWVLAVVIAMPVVSIVGGVLHGLGVGWSGAAGVLLAIVVVPFIKRALDERSRDTLGGEVRN